MKRKIVLLSAVLSLLVLGMFLTSFVRVGYAEVSRDNGRVNDACIRTTTHVDTQPSEILVCEAPEANQEHQDNVATGVVRLRILPTWRTFYG
jgi:hypothetical protein